MKVIQQPSKRGASEILLIYFAGWGTTPEAVAHLQYPDTWDYWACFDYTSMDPMLLPECNHYKQVYLVAWSMGVWAAEQCSKRLPPNTHAIAVNGTPYPMNDLYGIPTAIFTKTLEGLDDDNRNRFNRRMCGGKSLTALYNSFAARSTDDLRAELLSVYQALTDKPVRAPQIIWNRALVSERDLIMPADNQIAYWSQYGIPFQKLENTGHYPFIQYKQWEEILQ